jgi:membrane-bound lytic murein transglycosylase A
MKPSARLLRAAVSTAFLLLAAACAEEPKAQRPAITTTAGDRLSLTPVDFTALPGWTEDNLGEAIAALGKSCNKIADLPPSQPIGREGTGGTAGDWLGPCGALRDLNTADTAGVRRYFETWFKPMKAVANGGAAGGLFTGYYEAELTGALKRDVKHRVPLYARPSD